MIMTTKEKEVKNNESYRNNHQKEYDVLLSNEILPGMLYGWGLRLRSKRLC